MIERADIEAAAERTRRYVRLTPVIRVLDGDFGVANLTLKLEHLQVTGSFKPRGALNRMLSNSLPAAGVIAASGGNHGLAVAWAARTLGCAAEVFVPESVPATKLNALRRYGANIRLHGATYAEALAASHARAIETGALQIHAYDQPEVVAGQGTVGLELSRQAPELDTVLVAVGGGGLIGGIASWYRRNVRIIGVEPEGSPTISRALAAGRIIDITPSGLAADSLGASRAGSIAFDAATRWVDHTVVVTERAIGAAQAQLWETTRLVVEPGGATALAALIDGAYIPAPGEQVGVILCGGNTDPAEGRDAP